MSHKIQATISLFIFLLTFQAHGLPDGIKLIPNVKYGSAPEQKFDVYKNEDANDAPVIFMIHGGAWRGGDKARDAEYINKVMHWVPKGFVFISTNYRTLPDVQPNKQHQDVQNAILFAQQHIQKWGGSSKKFILMGHSAGAHLVAYISANSTSTRKMGIKPWLGTISLDISAYDIVQRMTSSQPSKFYADTFGQTHKQWKGASPYYLLKNKIPPFLAVCSMRSPFACQQAVHFTNKAKSYGTITRVNPVDLSHGEINSELGKPSCYTSTIDRFLLTLLPELNSVYDNSDKQLHENCASIQFSYHI